MNRSELASIIDHTCLRPEAVPRDIERLCAEAVEYGFASACINPVWVKFAAGLLRSGGPFVCSVVGFPLGASRCVPEEAEKAVSEGASEVDMVIPVGLLKSCDLEGTSKYISEVVEAVPGIPVKVILETCLLTTDEIVTACRLSMESGASWVKTSTGFSTGGATASDVSLMKSVVGDRLGVKASGGIRTLSDALAMVEAGAGRLGCSRSVEIVRSMTD